MAIYSTTPGFKERTFKFCVLNRLGLNFRVRSSPLRVLTWQVFQINLVINPQNIPIGWEDHPHPSLPLADELHVCSGHKDEHHVRAFKRSHMMDPDNKKWLVGPTKVPRKCYAFIQSVLLIFFKRCLSRRADVFVNKAFPNKFNNIRHSVVYQWNTLPHRNRCKTQLSQEKLG